MKIEFDIQGLDDTSLSLRAAKGRVGTELRQLLASTALRAEQEMRFLVPKGETLKLFESIRTSPLVYRPGGLGGGGIYEIEVGPGSDAPEHLQFVFGGTSDLFGKRMKIQKLGEPAHWIFSRKGQLPQRHWVEHSQETANRYLALQVGRMDIFR